MITMDEIARMANVSRATVDRVVHNRGKVSKEKEREIKKLLKKYNYVPNHFASQLRLGKQYRIGVIMPDLQVDGAYWKLPYRGICRACDELVANNVEKKFIFYDKYSVGSFIRAFDNINEDSFDGLLIAPVMTEPIYEIIKRLPSELPYVFFDSYLPRIGSASYIGEDPYGGGFLAGKLMNLLIKEKYTLIAFRLKITDFHIDERIRGFKDYFIKKRANIDLKVIDLDVINREVQVYNIIKEEIEKSPHFKGIFIPNALTYLAALALEKLQPNDKIHLIGYDLIEENIKYLKAEIIDFLIDQRSEEQGYKGIYALYKHLSMNINKRLNNSNIYLPVNIITQENIKYYIN
jgi:LacI family transcriptional regulator